MEFAIGLDPLISTLHQLVHLPEHSEKHLTEKTRNYLQEKSAVASTAVDVKENPRSYIFVADMPGLTRSDIQVQVENDNVLSISGKRKREEKSDEETKFIRLERKPTKFMRKFSLPSDVNFEKISATCQDGVLTVTVPKLPPPEPEKPKTIDIPVS
ncbi:hypothetical protein O6H91_14G003100 [Diphasiastrum complanatum]|uniref:Uncharacterized protein n=1 Tax=Diphasiastrum complanatum TaxID=34168 RepID=A0ACC2BKW6_DIPCM|nr:hypothetical protein O6H91_Y055300 [Diphasiastrum complanatum]KAJ7530411.1 hypothetical protein O6H91_14G003100 [Diphasiastrum complanatum]